MSKINDDNGQDVIANTLKCCIYVAIKTYKPIHPSMNTYNNKKAVWMDAY